MRVQFIIENVMRFTISALCYELLYSNLTGALSWQNTNQKMCYYYNARQQWEEVMTSGNMNLFHSAMSRTMTIRQVHFFFKTRTKKMCYYYNARQQPADEEIPPENDHAQRVRAIAPALSFTLFFRR